MGKCVCTRDTFFLRVAVSLDGYIVQLNLMNFFNLTINWCVLCKPVNEYSILMARVLRCYS